MARYNRRREILNGGEVTMPKSLEKQASGGWGRELHIAFLKMSGVKTVDIAKLYGLSSARVYGILKRYWRRCEAIRKCPSIEYRSEHPNIDIIKSLYEDKDDDNAKRK
jgi:hypothetical protein